jgi:hypothetical protein
MLLDATRYISRFAYNLCDSSGISAFFILSAQALWGPFAENWAAGLDALNMFSPKSYIKRIPQKSIVLILEFRAYISKTYLLANFLGCETGGVAI